MMKKVLRIIFHPDFVPLLIVIFIAVLAGRSLLFQSGYFNMHDDLQMMRQLQMEKCFLDRQIPCRWVPDMGYGFGFPLFNFYPPLPYLIGQGIRFIGFSFITTVKLTFALSIIASGIGMYLLAKEFFGRAGGVLSSVFYIWAPYHAVDVYVRGAMNESWALAAFPFIFWSAYGLIRSDKDQNIKWTVLLALSYFTLFTSHNLMLLIFTPLFGVFVLIHLWTKGKWLKLPWLLISGIWSLGLAAFFTLPALLENKFTQVEGQLVGYYDYTGHFVTIRQLLVSRFWGYGPSVWLEDDGMSFQIGHVHWILSALLLVGITLYAIKLGMRHKKKIVVNLKTRPVLLTVGLLLLAGWIAAFMTHSRSTPIWLAIPPLRYLQFPWRFLSIVIFGFSFGIGVIPHLLRIKPKFLASLFPGSRIFGHVWGFLSWLGMTAVSILLIILVIVVNWNYFTPEHGRMGPLTDEEKFTDAAWELQQTAGIYDYLPNTAVMAPQGPREELVEIIEGEVEITRESEGTNWAEFTASVNDDIAILRLGILDFPGWRVLADGRETEHYVAEDEMWGRMYVDLPSGDHDVRVEFVNTPVRTASNYISLFSWAIMFYLIIFYRKAHKIA